MNRLSKSISPYLLQHADNPVAWHEWGAAAFAEAAERDVPIFLSVGYSACHWCHVMAHESFEDSDTAAIMNDLFVNVKVDREERPDVDSIYMDAVQAMTGRGGWPMSVWLTPTGLPFHAGTYFPPTPRHGMPSFLEVCSAVSRAWKGQPDEVLDHAARLTAAVSRVMPPAEENLGAADLTAAFEMVRRSFDATHGGFGGAPKFPQAPVLHFLLNASVQPWADGATGMLHITLDRMAAGGLRDHVGGGFSRYTVDGHWEIPHFEKMLYDNAQLAALYLRAWRAGGPDRYRDIAVETIGYVLRDLTLPGGGFASAEDADSEGEEGLFYTWTSEEFAEVAGESAAITGDLWGVTATGNFEGRNHLRLVASLEEVATRHAVTPDEVEHSARQVLNRLFERRNRRVRPGLDDKVVAAWNGLMLTALAEAGAALGEERFLAAGRANARFVLSEMRDADSGLLHRSWAKGRLGPGGVLADQAGYGLGLLALYEATGEPEWFTAAEDLIRAIPGHFMDGATVHATTATDLIARPQDLSDNPEPSGSSLAHEAFRRLGMLTNDITLLELAETVAKGSARIAERSPTAVGHLLATLSAHLDAAELAIVGPDPHALLASYRSAYRPGVVLAWSLEPTSTPPLLAQRGEPGTTLAYVCRGFVCDRPVSTPDELRTRL